jgi:hypothetical protein
LFGYFEFLFHFIFNKEGEYMIRNECKQIPPSEMQQMDWSSETQPGLLHLTVPGDTLVVTAGGSAEWVAAGF